MKAGRHSRRKHPRRISSRRQNALAFGISLSYIVHCQWGCSSVRLERCVRNAQVRGSNPLISRIISPHLSPANFPEERRKRHGLHPRLAVRIFLKSLQSKWYQWKRFPKEGRFGSVSFPDSIGTNGPTTSVRNFIQVTYNWTLDRKMIWKMLPSFSTCG